MDLSVEMVGGRTYQWFREGVRQVTVTVPCGDTEARVRVIDDPELSETRVLVDDECVWSGLRS